MSNPFEKEDIRETNLVKKVKAYIDRVNNPNQDPIRSPNYPLDLVRSFKILNNGTEKEIGKARGRFLDVIAYAVSLKDFSLKDSYIKADNSDATNIMPDHDLDFLMS